MKVLAVLAALVAAVCAGLAIEAHRNIEVWHVPTRMPD